MPYELPNLNFEYDALEPHLDALTMEIHHSKHHAAYTANLNAAIEGTEMSDKTIEELLIEHQDNPVQILLRHQTNYYLQSMINLEVWTN